MSRPFTRARAAEEPTAEAVGGHLEGDVERRGVRRVLHRVERDLRGERGLPHAGPRPEDRRLAREETGHHLVEIPEARREAVERRRVE
jgi:hypothetical protein